MELTDEQLARNDDIDNAAHAHAQVLAEKEIEWDMELIGDITDAVKDVLLQRGIIVRHPGISVDEDGNEYYDDETKRGDLNGST